MLRRCRLFFILSYFVFSFFSLCFAAKKLQEKKKSKCMQEERKMMEQASTKHTTNRSNRLTGAARRKSLEEIFEVLLMSAEMSRDMTRQKNISTGINSNK